VRIKILPTSLQAQEVKEIHALFSEIDIKGTAKVTGREIMAKQSKWKIPEALSPVDFIRVRASPHEVHVKVTPCLLIINLKGEARDAILTVLITVTLLVQFAHIKLLFEA
jgi:hypothetical protein